MTNQEAPFELICYPHDLLLESSNISGSGTCQKLAWNYEKLLTQLLPQQ